VVYSGQKDLVLLQHSAVFTEGVEFDLSFHAPSYAAYKMISSVVSDFAAMNAKTQNLQITLSIPNRISYEMLQDFYSGFYSACNEYQINLIGGDMSAGHSALVVNIHASAFAEQSTICMRSGAEIGDAVCVTGDLGSAMAGLHILLREKKHWQEQGSPDIRPDALDLADYEYVVKRQLVPKARVDLIDLFHRERLKPTAMIDVSKGLINDLAAFCEASKCGVYLYQAALPIAIESRQVADEINEDVDKFAMYGGEDYELLFTMPENKVNELAKVFNDFAVIGKIEAQNEGLMLQKDDGEVVRFEE
jgi:thiamine-monophosphate kinase